MTDPYLTHSPYPAFVGVDLGQARDFSAVAVVQQVARQPGRYELTYLHRWRPRRYQEVPPVVRAVVDRLCQPVTVWRGHDHFRTERAEVDVIVDRTGVGRPVGDMLSETDLTPARLQLATITGGDTVTHDPDGGLRVPKRDLASSIMLALENGVLAIAAGLPLAETLVAEVINFRPTISAAGHDSYGAASDWRQGNHDDLLLATSLAVWFAERRNTRGGEVIVESWAHVGAQDRADDAIDALWEAEWPTPYSRR